MKHIYLLYLLIVSCLNMQAQQLVKDINSTLSPTSRYSSGITNMMAAGNKTYFVADDGTSGDEPWVTDGTVAGTHILRDINPGKLSSAAAEFTLSNGSVYFRANDGTHGAELWKTDGTAEGTIMVTEINTSFSTSTTHLGSFPNNLCDVNGVLYFCATNKSSYTLDYGVWKTDGTAAGTVQVNDLNTNTNSYNPGNLVSFDGMLYFAEAKTNTFRNAIYRITNAGETQLVQENINSGKFSVVGNTLFFLGQPNYPNLLGAELWKITNLGAEIVKEINPGNGASSPAELTNVNGTLFFSAWDGVNGQELWKSDGTDAGTVMVKDIYLNNNTNQYPPTQLTAVDGTLYFNAFTLEYGKELWKSDGTEAGTFLVKDIVPGSSNPGGNPLDLINVNGTLFFTSGPADRDLWKTDGTAEGTVVVKLFNNQCTQLTLLNGMPGKLVLYGGDLIANTDIWISDGTTDGTTLLKNIANDNPGSLVGPASNKFVGARFAYSNNQLFFSGKNTNTENYSFYKTKGDEATTQSLVTAAAINFPADALNVNGKIYFKYNTPPAGVELWVSDGTVAGTHLIKDIRPGTTGCDPNFITNVNGTVFFNANDGTNGIELWKTDGTEAGTVLVKDIRTGNASSTPAQLINFKGILFFAANDGVNGNELWKSDGTEAGTVLVKNIYAGNLGSLNSTSGTTSNSFTVAGNQLFFSALSSASNKELWKTDGTTAGTLMVKDIATSLTGSSDPKYITASGNNVFFVAHEDVYGINEELYFSDGSTLGTYKIKEINPGDKPSSPNNLVMLNGILYFSAYEPSTGFELWRSDGSEAGTYMVKDIEPGILSGMPSGAIAGYFGVEMRNVALSNGFIYFAAATATNGRELWKSDGTTAGTMMVNDLFPGPQSSDPEQITKGNNDIYFVAENGGTGKELYVYNSIINFILPPGGGENGIDINWENDLLVEGTNQIITTIKQSGLLPLNDSVHAKLIVAANAFTYNGRTLAKKHVDIEPAQNAAAATATVTLYFSQADFNDYNLADNLNGDLPTAAGDLLGKTNLRIIQYHGIGTQPGNYPGAEEIINPAEDSIVWNAANNYWEVSFSVTGFSGFYLSSATAGPLPVQLVTFTAALNAQKLVNLEWVVEQQQGIVRYEIERSTDNNFNTIGIVNANGQLRFTYRFTDVQPFSGTALYRLKIIDSDGSFTYSAIIKIAVKNNNSNISIYPNPVSSSINISVQADKEELVFFRLINSNGSSVANKSFMLKKGSNAFIWDVKQLAAGTYFITSTNKNFKVVQVVKQ